MHARIDYEEDGRIVSVVDLRKRGSGSPALLGAVVDG